MKAAIYRAYGPPEVVSWEEVAVPRPAAGEVLVRVEAAALNPKDIVLRKGKFRILSGGKFPKQLGLDLVGRVIGLGPGAPASLADQRVFGFFAGFRALRGSLAECTAIPAEWVAPISESVDTTAAAATPLAGSTALQALRDAARLDGGEHVLIVGASGGVGTFAVQIAKLFGARVTASTSARNAELVRALGADDVLDYTAASPLGTGPYDVVLDCFGKLRLGHVSHVLGRHGCFVSLVPSRGIFADIVVGAARGRRVRLTSVKPRSSDLAQLANWLGAGRLQPTIDRVDAPDVLHDTMRHLETRHARGKLVIRLG